MLLMKKQTKKGLLWIHLAADISVTLVNSLEEADLLFMDINDF